MVNHPDLDMKDDVKSRIQIEGPKICVRGSRKIDGAWITPDVETSAAFFLPFFFCVGNHKEFLLDIPQHQLIGGNVQKITRPNARQLKYSRHEIQQKYNNDLELYCDEHRIQKKV